MSHLTLSRSGLMDTAGKETRGFVVGTCAQWLGQKVPPGSSTHEWKVYLCAANKDEDISAYVKKVNFVLHPTLQPPERLVEAPGPFQVTEQGWGEFEIRLQIFFHDSRDTPVEVSHVLKLYEGDDSAEPTPSPRPVVSERYDEFVFTNPTAALRERLASGSKDVKMMDRHAELQNCYQVITSEVQQQSVRNAQLKFQKRTF